MRGRGRELMTNSTRYQLNSWLSLWPRWFKLFCFSDHNAIIVFRKLQETFKSRVQIVLFQFAPGCLISIIYQIGRETNLLWILIEVVEVEDARCGQCLNLDPHQLHFSRHDHNGKHSSENEEKKVEDKKRRRKGRAGRKEEVRKRKIQDMIDFDRCAWIGEKLLDLLRPWLV